MTKDWFSKFRQGLRNAFSLRSPHGPLTDEDHQLLRKLAQSIVARGWAMPAVATLCSVQPLNSLASQALVFLRPFQEPLHLFLKPVLKRIFDEQLLAGQDQYDRLVAILDRREGIETFVEAIEEEQEKQERQALGNRH
jgi:hypothetical protein